VTIDILPFLGDSVRVSLTGITDKYGNLAVVQADYSSETVYQTGVNDFILDTNVFDAGTYFLRFKGVKDQRETLHKLIVADNQ
jgi:hypothetical protein